MDRMGWKFAFGALIVVTLGAAGGLIASTSVASQAYKFKFKQTDKHEQTLVVTGSARKRIHSDLAVWKINISADAKELSEAYKIIKDSDAKVMAFLAAHKFAAAEIAAGAISTQANYRVEWKDTIHGQEKRETRDIESYTLQRGYTVTTERVDSVAAPASGITELIEQGVKIISSAPDYYYSKIADLKVEMIGEASRDARARADQVVNNAGCKIAEVRHARMGVLQITQPDSTAVSDSGIYDTSTIEKDVTSVVSLTLGIR